MSTNDPKRPFFAWFCLPMKDSLLSVANLSFLKGTLGEGVRGVRVGKSEPGEGSKIAQISEKKTIMSCLGLYIKRRYYRLSALLASRISQI